MKILFYSLVFCFFLSGCDNNDSITGNYVSQPSSFETKSAANPLYDENYKGIYKGNFTGAINGAMKIDYENSGKQILTIYTDNEVNYTITNPTELKINLKPSVRNTIQFINENIELVFSVNIDGSLPKIEYFNFNNHLNINSIIEKEKSKDLIQCFVGMYTGNAESGYISLHFNKSLGIKGLSTIPETKNINIILGKLKSITSNNEQNPDEFSTDKTPNTSFTNSIEKFTLEGNLHYGQLAGSNFDNFNYSGNWIYNSQKKGDWRIKRIL